MNYEDIKKIIEDVGNANIDELQVEFPDGGKISIKKNNTINCEKGSIKETKAIEGIVENKQQIDNEDDCNLIKSPMVGTFYSSSSPKSAPFVKVGDKVKKGQVLCIIEAMKLMNEIESEFDGEIQKVCVKDEDIVEYGQTLFKIKK